ncbi:MAG: RluA family pseudouridine synthase [Candidatus Nomurabacteria bacterium]|nr:MAG: RluA family pseudouridine synthase [Candidatus Nomurabacteria bacterium]
MRLDAYLAQYWPEHSRATWQKYVKAGYVTVNGEVEKSTKRLLDEDDKVETSVPDAQTHDDQSLPIIYQDKNVIVINKPTGILSHSKGVLNDEFTVAGFFKRFTKYNVDTNRPGIIHRLDRDTSGVLIGALNDKTAKLLQRQFSDRKVKKTYIAVVDGIPKQSEALIDLPIGRNPKHPSQFRVDPNGKSAQTAYRILASSKKYSLVELQPHTGRTHQLRVHMAYIGTPIHGDKVYGKQADRLYLHAAKLEITIPEGERMLFAADVPPEFASMEMA